MITSHCHNMTKGLYNFIILLRKQRLKFWLQGVHYRSFCLFFIVCGNLSVCCPLGVSATEYIIIYSVVSPLRSFIKVSQDSNIEAMTFASLSSISYFDLASEVTVYKYDFNSIWQYHTQRCIRFTIQANLNTNTMW